MLDYGPPSTSSQLGKYHLLGELGRGGMAGVFLAAVSGPARFNKLVVVKEIQPDLAREPEFVMMFLDVARLAARLNHPNVVQTNEVGQEGYRFFMVMEYLEGQTLRTVHRRIGRGPGALLTLGMKLRIVCEALAGLHYAHEVTDFDGTPLSVVHRDVSPHNIFVTYSGQVKVLDFGIAKALDSVSQTSTGVLKGKVHYMAPEHAQGAKVDRRADVYAAGIVLWELATGERMWREMPQVAVLNNLMKGEVPRPSTVSPDIDPRLEAIIMKSLAYDPDQRYPSAAAFADDLEAFLREIGDHCSLRQMGDIVQRAFAEERERQRSLIERQIARLSEATSPGDVQPVQLFDAQASSTSLAAANLVSISGQDNHPSLTPPTLSKTRTVLVSEREDGGVPSRRPRWPWFAAAGGALVILASTLLLKQKAESSEAQSPSSPSPAAYTLRIESTPDGARVSCAGKIMGATPLDVPLTDGERPCAFVVSLDGYEPYTVERGPVNGDVTVAAQLRPVAAATSSSVAAGASASAPTVRPRGRLPATTPRSVQPPKPKGDIRLRR